MSRIRMPWPWEAPYPDLPIAHPTRDGAAEMLGRLPDTGPSVVGGGEIRNAISVRDTRERLYQDALSITDGSDAAREWAATKADKAIRTWDRGVRAGTITQSDRG